MLAWIRRRLGTRGSALEPSTPTTPDPEAVLAAQAAYWRFDAEEADSLRAWGIEQLSWRRLLRLHHLWCVQLLEKAVEDAASQVTLTPLHREVIATLASRSSPFRPRHGFIWRGDGPPAGEDIPYSDHQGRVASAALTHLGCIELVRIPEAGGAPQVDFLPFDELMTLASPRTPQGAGIRPASLLMEYGAPAQTVWLPEVVGPATRAATGTSAAPPVVTLEGGQPRLPPPYDDPKAEPPPLIAPGPAHLRCRSDFVDEGTRVIPLDDCYQLSLAIDQDDPRFTDKCRGRGIDPDETRASVAAEQTRRRPKLRLKTLS